MCFSVHGIKGQGIDLSQDQVGLYLQSTNPRRNDLPKDSDGTDVHLGIAEPFTEPQRRYTLRPVCCIATCSFCAAQLG